MTIKYSRVCQNLRQDLHDLNRVIVFIPILKSKRVFSDHIESLNLHVHWHERFDEQPHTSYHFLGLLHFFPLFAALSKEPQSTIGFRILHQQHDELISKTLDPPLQPFCHIVATERRLKVTGWEHNDVGAVLSVVANLLQSDPHEVLVSRFVGV